MENFYHQTTRRNFLNQLGLAAAGMTTGNTALAATQYDSGIPRNSVPDRTSDNSAKRVIMISLDGICVEGFQKAHAPSLKGSGHAMGSGYRCGLWSILLFSL